MNVVVHPDAGAFLARARPWLEKAEDEHNLILGLALGLASAPAVAPGPDAPLFATVEDDGHVVGCAFRTPPHKLGLTRMPLEGAALVAEVAAERYPSVPAVLGPREEAWAAAEAWVTLRGGEATRGMKARIHRLEIVEPPVGVGGRMRLATEDDLDLAAEWAEGFARDTGEDFRPPAGAQAGWIQERKLHLWDVDGAAVCMALATGATYRGVRIGYVYTPAELRGRGYASALTAALSQKMLDAGCAFCVLYTDLANPTSNAIYARIGYRPVCDVEDVVLEPNQAGM